MKTRTERQAAKGTTRRVGRRATPRAEWLEGRIVLNSSIAIDAEGGLTLNLGGKLNISVADGVFTFDSQQFINVTSNAAGLKVWGGGTETVGVSGVQHLTINVAFDQDELQITSTDVATAINVTVPSHESSSARSRTPPA